MSADATPVIPLEYAPPPENTQPIWRAVSLWAISLGWLCCVVGWLLIAGVDTESVVGSGPILMLFGIACVVSGIKLRSLWPIVIGASHVAIVICFIVMVDIWRLNPRTAYVPFTIVGGIYCMLISYPTYVALFLPRLDLRAFVPRYWSTDFIKELSEPLRRLVGFELMQGNVIDRVEHSAWSRCPLMVVLRDPLHFDPAREMMEIPVGIRRWENDDPRCEPQAGWVCSITLQALAGPIQAKDRGSHRA